MISAVIPCLNAADRLPQCLGALVPGLVDGVLREAVVVDGGSDDASAAIAADLGCPVLTAPRGRASQLSAGISAARADWLLLLHADTVLSPDWVAAARGHIETTQGAGLAPAGYFRLGYEDKGLWPDLVASGGNWRARWLGLPYGDQGLLIHRATLEAVGGIAPLPFLEDLDLVRRLKRTTPLRLLPATALTSAARYKRDGWLRRSSLNLLIAGLFLAGVPAATLARLYR